MHISRAWLQTFFDTPLPSTAALSDALTFHAFEIDGLEKVGDDDVLDVKVTPNRGHDCLSHRGIAKELSAILKLPLKADPLSKTLQSEQSATNVMVSIENQDLCKRYVAAYMRGVEVKESPQWLKASLEALGQRSINNVVDATNYVMFNLGQPLHAFDAGKLQEKDGTYALAVRTALPGEKLVALDEKEYALGDSMLVIADAHANKAVGIAGVKGGMPAGITYETKDIVLESANFDGVSVRKTAQALKLRTDASQRFEQGISPELAGYGMQAVVELIEQIAGGGVMGFIDAYPHKPEPTSVSVTTTQVVQVLGTTFGEKEIIDSFERLGFSYTKEGDVFVVTPPFERLDLQIAEDLIEEVGRIQGYDRVPPTALPPFSKEVEINKNFYWTEKIKEFLVSKGFSEVFTSVFDWTGERAVLNKVDSDTPYLRTSITPSMQVAVRKNLKAPELLGLPDVRLFEIGTVFTGGNEQLYLCVGSNSSKVLQGLQNDLQNTFNFGSALMSVSDSGEHVHTCTYNLSKCIGKLTAPKTYDDLPLSQTQQYKPFSKFPYIVRDVAFWTVGASEQDVAELITKEAGELCVKVALFDTFTKGDKTSYAFRLIFQSFEKTLTDDEVNGVMEKVYAALAAKGFEIR